MLYLREKNKNMKKKNMFFYCKLPNGCQTIFSCQRFADLLDLVNSLAVY